ncbi:MAG: hypothetical protein QW706_09705 [Candidatus Nezhaarchaeales archaeon]
MEVDFSVVLQSVLTALILYLIKKVLELDKRVEVLKTEIKHLREAYEKVIRQCRGKDI